MKKLLTVSVVSFLLSFATIFFVPFTSFEQEESLKVLAYILAFAFWLFLIIGIIFLFLFFRRRKNSRHPVVPRSLSVTDRQTRCNKKF